MAELASASLELLQGQPSRRLSLPNGDSLQVALQGAQALSWVAGGVERLYLSPRSVFDGISAIRGGIPVCFPQFNQRGPLPKHGFARNLLWRCDEAPHLTAQEARITLQLSASEASRAFWPSPFDVTLTLQMQAGQLEITLGVRNTGDEPLFFTGALHTYLAIGDITAVQLEGLQGQPEWDAVTDQLGTAAGTLRFQGEFDRVYAAASRALTLRDGTTRLAIEQSASFEHTVVWNPGVGKCASLADMPPDGYRHMLCVEAAQVMAPVSLQAGGQWRGWQRLSVQ